MSDIDREAFERWYSQEGEYSGLPLDQYDEDGDYVDEFVQSMWMAWQAARQAPASGEVEPIGEIDEGDEGAFVDLYPDNTFTIGQKVYTHPPAKVPEGWLLRKQAEAVEASAEYLSDGDGIDVACQELDDYAQRLRQQAAESEDGAITRKTD